MPTPPGPGMREEPGFVRDLGAMERILHFYASEHPRHFCVVAEIEGTIDPAKCRAAFDAVQARHPMLSVCVRDDPQRGPGIYRCDRPLKVGFSSVDEEPDWRRVVERELATPFADSEGPLMRATVMYGAHGASIVLTSHHVLSDGMSEVFIVQDLMEALDGRPLARLPELPSQERLVADVLLPEGRTIDPEMPDGLDERRFRAIADAPLWRPFEGDTPLVHTIEFDAPFSARLRRRSRENATTLNGALCAALVQCVASAATGGPRDVRDSERNQLQAARRGQRIAIADCWCARPRPRMHSTKPATSGHSRAERMQPLGGPFERRRDPELCRNGGVRAEAGRQPACVRLFRRVPVRRGAVQSRRASDTGASRSASPEGGLGHGRTGTIRA